MTERVMGGAVALALALATASGSLAQEGTAPPAPAAIEAPAAAPQPEASPAEAAAPLAPAPAAPALPSPEAAAPAAAPTAAAPTAADQPAGAQPAADAAADPSAAAPAPAAEGAAPSAEGAEAADPVEPGAPVVMAGAEGAEPESEGPVKHDLSPWGMFMAADLVVKSVMIGLAFASLVTWTIAIAKSLELLGAGARARRGLRALAGSATLADADEALATAGGPIALMVRAARAEARDSAAAIRAGEVEGLLPRISSSLARIEVGAGRRLMSGTGLLATIGSTAPFVGLFGTVWGIMNSFIGISEAQTTNLAVVAPGIAEALLATALGLVAAIPAVMIYNHFARQTAAYKARLADAAAAVERLASRDLDHGRLASGRAALAAAAE